MRASLRHYFLVFLMMATTMGIQSANANIIGSDFQSFNPTSDGLDFVTVQSVRTLAPGVLGVGGFIDAAYNTLPPALDANQNKFSVKDQLFSSDLHVALGLTRWWEVGANLSAVLLQSLSTDQLRGYFVKNGLTDFRMNTKFRLLGTGSSGLSANLSVGFPQIVNDPFYGDRGGPVDSAAELIAQTKVGRLTWAVNAGMAFRPVGAKLLNAPYEPVGNQFTASTGIEYRIEKTNFAVIGELFSAVPLSRTDHYSVSELTALEALLGAKYFGFKNFTAHTGLTAQMMDGTASPDVRFYAGLNWYPARLWGRSMKTVRPADPEVAERVKKGATFGDPDLDIPVATSSASNTTVFDKEPVAKVERFIVRDINFAVGSAEVPETFEPYLRKLAEYLQKGTGFTYLQIYGYTDSTGSAMLNQELSQKRAEAVKQFLVTRFSVEGEKIESIGMGPANPVATNETVEGRSLNRRVEFKIDR